MNEFEILKEHYSHLLPILENTVYNVQQDITKYFGQEIMVIYNGHGGEGWDIRKLAGIYENDDRYLVLERPEGVGVGRSLVELKRWFLFIVLPENIKKMKKTYWNGRRPAPIRPSLENGDAV